MPRSSDPMTDQGTGPSATASRNGAADRLRGVLQGCTHHFEDEPLLDAALSEERRLTVERIRERLTKAVESRDFMAGPLQPSAMLHILDEVTGR